MLVPFYFLIGGWGSGDRVRATTKFVIYTLSGSLLMMAAAIALGVLATPDGGEISFSLADLQQRSVAEGSQHWIVLLFALAFFVKAPLFPLHGWVPDTYRATSIPVLALLSGVLSKVGVYGFLRIVLPVMPEGAQYWQELFIIIAVFSILYGSILAFSHDNIRLVVAYSSIAQLGFIVLGIFALEEKGAQGALFQMLNHGLVVVPLFLIIGVIAVRAGGSESLRELGGMAFRAPVLAGLFLVTTLATLAMPGSANFVGELLILFGAFEDKLVYGLVASAGVALAAVYMIRLYQGTMHGRVGPTVASREIDGVNLAAVAPLVAIVIALGVYPHFVVDRTERDTTRAIAEASGARQAAAADRDETPFEVGDHP
jgi:NADH-quinone oxidoreductase subunit M